MNENSPLVSVIVPAYNAEQFISLTLDSLVSQTYSNFEVIVVDDGSQDGTAEIVDDYASRDRRIKLFQQANAGVAIARNQAIHLSQGQYIAPIDADDIWYPQKLEKQVQCFSQADASVGLVYSWSADIDESDRITGGFYTSNLEGDVYIPLIYYNFLGNASSPLIRRECFEKVGGYNSKLKALNAQGCEDWELYLRIAEEYEFRVVPELLIGYRQFAGSMSANPIAMQRSYEVMMTDLQQRHPEIPARLFKWANSHYYCYLAERSIGRQNYQQGLVYLLKAVQLDYLPLLYLGRYRVFLTTLLKLSTQLVVQNQVDAQPQQRRLYRKVLSLEDLYQKVDKKSQGFLWKLRNGLLQRRWQQVAIR